MVSRRIETPGLTECVGLWTVLAFKPILGTLGVLSCLRKPDEWFSNAGPGEGRLRYMLGFPDVYGRDIQEELIDYPRKKIYPREAQLVIFSKERAKRRFYVTGREYSMPG
jgi:hypothetical protein